VLKEYRNVKQEPQGRRRWFEDEDLELIVWYSPAGSVTGFQICYEAEDGRERALTWRAGEGFDHARVDLGGTNPFKNLTPILLPDTAVPWVPITELVRSRSEPLEAELRELVLARLVARN
jgi:hypothetical protein